MKLTKFENPGNEFKEIYGGKSPENPSDGQSQDKTKPFIRPPSMITGILAGFLLQQIVKIYPLPYPSTTFNSTYYHKEE